jgi:hypothetical protein
MYLHLQWDYVLKIHHQLEISQVKSTLNALKVLTIKA